MLIPEEHRFDFIDDHSVKNYLKLFENVLFCADEFNMNGKDRMELLNNIIVLRMIKLIEDYCE